MKRQQTYKGSSFKVMWMRGTLVYDISLPPTTSMSSAHQTFFETIEGIECIQETWGMQLGFCNVYGKRPIPY